MEPTLSIIVPVYNVEQYLSRCIDSILEQTFKDFELILINDGSTDKSGEICDKYQYSDERIFVIHKENNGLSSARNEGLNRAKGKFIMFIDSDDVLGTIDTIQINIEKLIRYKKKSFIQFPTLWLHKDTGKEELQKPANAIYKKDTIYNAFFHHQITNTVWDKIYTRDIFQDIRFPIGLYFEDSYCIVDILKATNNVITSNSGYYKYIIRKGSITQSGLTRKLIEDYFTTISRLMSLAKEHNNTDIYRVNSILKMIDKLAYGKILISKEAYTKFYSIVIKFMPEYKAIFHFMYKNNFKKGIKVLFIKILGFNIYYNLYLHKK